MVEPATATVRSVLRHVFGLLGKETRGRIANQCKGGKVGGDEESRRFIVGELDNVLGNFNGIGRKDLLSSVCFLQDGVNELYQFLHLSHSGSIDRVTEVKAVSSSDAGFYSSENHAIALENAVQLPRSSEYFRLSTRNFMLAREMATKAFNNEALSFEDRIQAYQVRMIAKILEDPKNPNVGVGDCLRHFNQLFFPHPGLLETSFHHKNRVNIVTAVEAMKPDLFDLAMKFTKLAPNVYVRKPISHDESLYNPELWDDIQEKSEVGKCLGPLFYPQKEVARGWKVCAMDVDEYDNTYVITASRKHEGEKFKFGFFIFNSSGNQKLECSLPFFKNHFTPAVSMAICKLGKIAFLDRVNKKMIIGYPSKYSNAYEVEKKFDIDVPLSMQNDPKIDSSKNIRFFYSNDEIKIVVLDRHTVYIYDINGELEERIGIPEKHGTGVFLEIDHDRRRFLIEAWRPVKSLYDNLVQFLESGNPPDIFKYEHLFQTSHRPVLLVGEQGADYLRPLTL